ncbi:hypothetical protein [Saccharothrix sp. Mg75]|uniref:hypothetical protein n=1 Tax=Saccharothrix sp. Mg75 TaxID=3445357 RepID=UPI003EED462B
MGSRFRQLSVIESSGGRARFRRIDRHDDGHDMPGGGGGGEGGGGEGDLKAWTLRRLSAHRCPLGLYVGEAGTGEEDVETNVWVAWDGAFPFPVEE